MNIIGINSFKLKPFLWFFWTLSKVKILQCIKCHCPQALSFNFGFVQKSLAPMIRLIKIDYPDNQDQ